MSEGYRCCAHCADDPVHEVEPDSHEVPCNAPNSGGCIGKKWLATSPTPNLSTTEGENDG
jgi:hypothetical protein